MDEVLTPERVLEIGQEWKRLLIQHTPKAELKELISTELKQELIEQGIEQGIGVYIDLIFQRFLSNTQYRIPAI